LTAEDLDRVAKAKDSMTSFAYVAFPQYRKPAGPK